jgi:hypothetical protein
VGKAPAIQSLSKTVAAAVQQFPFAGMRHLSEGMTSLQFTVRDTRPDRYALLGLEPGCNAAQLRLAKQIAVRHWCAQAASNDFERRRKAKREVAAIQAAAKHICLENEWPEREMELPAGGPPSLWRSFTVQGALLAVLSLVTAAMLAGIAAWLVASA